MFCPNCGEQLEEGSLFCSNCGTKIENENNTEQKPLEEVKENPKEEQFYQQPEEKSKKNIKGIAGIVAAVVVVIALVKIVGGLFSGSSDCVIAVYDSENNETTLYRNNKKIDTVDGSANVYTNIEKSVFYVIADGDAYKVKGNKLKKVKDDCDYITVASHSDTALFIDDDGTLLRYDGSSLEEIADDVSSAVISGNGKVYAYSIYDAGDIKTYVGKKAGKEEKVKDLFVAAISKDGKYIYAIDEDSNLCNITLKGDVEVIAKDIDQVVALNGDGTEIMFVQDGKTYVSVKAKDKIKVTNGKVLQVYGSDTVNATNGMYQMKSFKDAVVKIEEDYEISVAILSGKYEAEEVVDEISTVFRVTDDLSKVYYKEDGNLYYAKIKEDADEKRIAKNVNWAWVSKDGSDIYFINEDEELCYVKGTGKEQVIDDDSKISSYAGFVADDVLYAREEDDWYYIKGQKSEKLKVNQMYYDAENDTVYAYCDDEVYTVEGKKLKPLKGSYENISSLSINGSYGWE